MTDEGMTRRGAMKTGAIGVLAAIAASSVTKVAKANPVGPVLTGNWPPSECGVEEPVDLFFDEAMDLDSAQPPNITAEVLPSPTNPGGPVPITVTQPGGPNTLRVTPLQAGTVGDTFRITVHPLVTDTMSRAMAEPGIVCEIRNACW